MRLQHLRVENFRALEKMEVDFQPMTVVIGENDVGKTSCMLAVQTLFEVRKLESKCDFFKGDTDRKVVIEASFTCAKPSEFQRDYVCGGLIRIRCTYPFNALRQVQVRRRVPNSVDLRDIDDKAVADLRRIVASLGLIDDPAKTPKSELQRILQEHASKLSPENCEESWSTIKEEEAKKLLPEFVLVPVGRLLDANLKLGETTLLGRLFRPLLKAAVEQLAEKEGVTEIRTTLKECVRNRVIDLQDLLRQQLNNTTVLLTHHVDLDPMKGLTFDFGMDDERATGIPIENRGAGVHNNLILAMFRLLAQYGTENFILAIEEPENSLHPRGQREMLWALQTVAKKAQVICTTHSTVFLDLGQLEHNVVLTRGAAGNTFARKFKAQTHADWTALRELLGIRISDALLSGGGNCALIVEGPTELHAYPHFFAMLGYNARALGVSIISAGGSDYEKIKQHITVLKVYDIPVVVVVDKDAQQTFDDLKGFGTGGELPNLQKVHLLTEGTFETYIPLDLAIGVINEHYAGPEIFAEDIDMAKDRVKEFEKAIYAKKGYGARFEHFKVQFGQLVGERMLAGRVPLHGEIRQVIETVKQIAERV